jgi:hypothetical protein
MSLSATSADDAADTKDAGNATTTAASTKLQDISIPGRIAQQKFNRKPASQNNLAQ